MLKCQVSKKSMNSQPSTSREEPPQGNGYRTQQCLFLYVQGGAMFGHSPIVLQASGSGHEIGQGVGGIAHSVGRSRCAASWPDSSKALALIPGSTARQLISRMGQRPRTPSPPLEGQLPTSGTAPTTPPPREETKTNAPDTLPRESKLANSGYRTSGLDVARKMVRQGIGHAGRSFSE